MASEIIKIGINSQISSVQVCTPVSNHQMFGYNKLRGKFRHQYAATTHRQGKKKLLFNCILTLARTFSGNKQHSHVSLTINLKYSTRNSSKQERNLLSKLLQDCNTEKNKTSVSRCHLMNTTFPKRTDLPTYYR